MSKSLIILPEAEQDITEAYDWYQERELGLGEEFLRCIDASIQTIARNPEIYVSVFSDDLAITIPDNRFDEDRFVTIGMDAFGRILVVVFTGCGEDIRLISARLAERRERKQYEED